MAGTKTKKRKTETADFKRIKAKVGKRALKPANETDTSFKTAEVNVAQQSIAQEGGQNSNNRQKQKSSGVNDYESQVETLEEIYSTRGRSLEDIVSHLRHPAAAVRISAAKGFKDAVSRQQVTPSLVRSQLAVLMPMCAKCLIDEDSEVRQLALAILRCIISKACTSSSASMEKCENVSDGHIYVTPFIPLLMAHVISALNSLDRKTQLDGTAVVGMLSSIIPSLIAPYRSDILPAYASILSQRSPQSPDLNTSASATGSAKKDGKKKRGRKPNNKSSESSVLRNQPIQSLLALLKSAKSRRRFPNVEANKSLDADLVVVSDGRGLNALFIPGRRQETRTNSANIVPLQTLEDLSNLQTVDYSSWTQGELNEAVSLSQDSICDLLGKLRDAFAEATQQELNHGRCDLNEVQLILESTHLLYKSTRHSSATSATAAIGSGEKAKRSPNSCLKVWSQYIALVMGVFPFSSPSGTSPASFVLDVNLETCTTILDAYLDGVNTDRGHLDRVLAYLFSELENCRPPVENTNSEVDKNNSTSTKINSVDSLFEALERLLVISSNQRKNDDEQFAKAINRRLVKAVASTFFPAELAMQVKEKAAIDMARSWATRKCLILAREIFSQCEWSITDPNSTFGAVLIQILRGLVTCMVAWGSDFLYETSETVTLLHNVVRRLDVTGQDMLSEEFSPLIDHIRLSLVIMVKHKKKCGSAFESFPVALQRKFVGLVVMVQVPDQGMLDGLSRSCARCWEQRENAISPDIASLIVQSIHTIRKTISMQAYLGFVIQSMGMDQFSSSKTCTPGDTISSTKDILRLDDSIKLSCSVLCQCGPSRVLPMLQPLLERWMSIKEASTPSFEWSLIARAALSVLAVFGSNDLDMPVFQMVPDLKIRTTKTICAWLEHIPSCDDKSPSYNSDEQELAAFLEPISVLFQNERELLYIVCNNVASNIDKVAISDQTRLVSALLVFVNDFRLLPIIKNQKDLIECAKTIESALSSTSAERLAGRLRALLEIHSGCDTTPGTE